MQSNKYLLSRFKNVDIKEDSKKRDGVGQIVWVIEIGIILEKEDKLFYFDFSNLPCWLSHINRKMQKLCLEDTSLCSEINDFKIA